MSVYSTSIYSPLFFFTDAVLRGPTLGCMLMCLASGLMGVLIFLRKQSLLGESLTHAAYPGVIIGVTCAGVLDLNANADFLISLLVMGGAFISALCGFMAIRLLSRHFKVPSDAALCFILSGFFGLGLTLASYIQFHYPGLYKQAQAYLYGQAATMTDIHILLYGALSLLIVIVIVLFYKEILVTTFDLQYATTLAINTKLIDTIIFILTVLAIVIGIRSVGIVLMSAMLIAPAVTARQCTHRLGWMFTLAAFFGMLSAFLGNYLSIIVPTWFPDARISLPTGPMIVIVASSICLTSLLFAPERGLLLRFIRIAHFRHQCLCENLLKAIWRFHADAEINFDLIASHQSAPRWYLRLILNRLCRYGWVRCTQHGYSLTTDGHLWAARIVRLHRLWEVYLVDYVGVGVERVHRSAEEMEHIITPELEKELTALLRDPTHDPHDQPIPKGGL